MRVWRLAFGVRGFAFGVETDGVKANGRFGDSGEVVATDFEDEDDDE
jgi:hypothetical protein